MSCGSLCFEKLVHVISVLKSMSAEMFAVFSYHFDISMICKDILCCIHGTDNLGLLSFFLFIIVRGLSIFFEFLKDPAFYSFDFLSCFQLCTFLLSSLLFTSLYLLWVYFDIFLPSFLRWELRILS